MPPASIGPIECAARQPHAVWRHLQQLSCLHIQNMPCARHHSLTLVRTIHTMPWFILLRLSCRSVVAISVWWSQAPHEAHFLVPGPAPMPQHHSTEWLPSPTFPEIPVLEGEALQAVIVLYSFTLAVPLHVASTLLYHYMRYHAHLGFKVVQYSQVGCPIPHAAVSTCQESRCKGCKHVFTGQDCRILLLM